MRRLKLTKGIVICVAMALTVICSGIVLGVALLQAVDTEYPEYMAYTEDASPGQEKYVLKVEDEIIGAAYSREEIYDVLETILEEYSTAVTEYIWFVPDISVVRQAVDEDIVKDTETLLKILTPSNEASGLVVESVDMEVMEEKIPYETEYVEDDTLYEGETVLIHEGQVGLLHLTETVVRLNGIEQSRYISEFAQLPVNERIAIGTMPMEQQYIWPADGPITSVFGYRVITVGSSNHRGLDIGGRQGDPIFAAKCGNVIFSGWSNSGYGNKIVIRHDNGDETLYAHLSETLVQRGEHVYQGQTIGGMGTTGTSTGVHLHFEIIIDGIQMDPLLFLP